MCIIKIIDFFNFNFFAFSIILFQIILFESFFKLLIVKLFYIWYILRSNKDKYWIMKLENLNLIKVIENKIRYLYKIKYYITEIFVKQINFNSFKL